MGVENYFQYPSNILFNYVVNDTCFSQYILTNEYYGWKKRGKKNEEFIDKTK